MTDSEHDSAPPGRPVVLVPTPRGFWMAVIGVCMAAASPLFGFLVGTILGTPTGDDVFGPMFLGLFIGIAFGAIGVVAAVIGGHRLWVDRHRDDAADATDVETPVGRAP